MKMMNPPTGGGKVARSYVGVSPMPITGAGHVTANAGMNANKPVRINGASVQMHHTFKFPR